MDDHGVHADLAHQHDVAGEIGQIFAHRVAADLDDDGRALVALEIGEGLAERPGGGDPVAVHLLLSHGRFLVGPE